jgi:hypothetical protein
MAQLEGTAGARTLAAGQSGPFRLGTQGELVAQAAHAKHYEAVRSGNCFTGGTAITGVAPGTAIGTTAAFALYNPQGSGKNLVVLHTTLVYVSGTLGIGNVDYIGHLSPSQVAFTGTAITPRNCLVGNTGTGVGLAFTTATVPASGARLRGFCTLPPILATSVIVPWSVADEVDGAICIAPGGGISLQATAGAGSSPLVAFTMTWEEVSA